MTEVPMTKWLALHPSQILSSFVISVSCFGFRASDFVIRAGPVLHLEKREHQLAFGNDGVVDQALALRFREAIAPRFR